MARYLGFFMDVLGVACMLLLCGCLVSRTSITRDILPPLEPSEAWIEKFERLQEWLKVQPNRMEAIQFIEQRLDRPFLTVRTQLRLGMLFQVVRGMASAGEYQSLRAVLAKGEKYPTFYWMALTKPSPEYIDLFFGVLTNKKDVLAYGFNPDGEKIEPYVLQEFVVADLQEATGKDFGRDDKKWREWWDVEGQHLEYDRDSGKYRGKVE